MQISTITYCYFFSFFFFFSLFSIFSTFFRCCLSVNLGYRMHHCCINVLVHFFCAMGVCTRGCHIEISAEKWFSFIVTYFLFRLTIVILAYCHVYCCDELQQTLWPQPICARCNFSFGMSNARADGRVEDISLASDGTKSFLFFILLHLLRSLSLSHSSPLCCNNTLRLFGWVYFFVSSFCIVIAKSFQCNTLCVCVCVWLLSNNHCCYASENNYSNLDYRYKWMGEGMPSAECRESENELSKLG